MGESDDLRAFIRDRMARFDRGMDATLARFEAQDRDNEQRHKAVMARIEEKARIDVQRHKAVMAHMAADRETMREMYAEDRAQRQALVHILDKLDGQGGEAPG